MKRKYVLVLTALLAFTAISLSASAQSNSAPVPPQSKELILVTADSDSTAATFETLSGIHLHRAKKGDYQLDFAQELKEDATLEITTKSGRRVYQKPVSIADKKAAWSYNVGKLKPGTYNVQVKTSDTTYWTSFRVRK